MKYLITLTYLSVCLSKNTFADEDFRIIAPRKRATETSVSKSRGIKKIQVYRS